MKTPVDFNGFIQVAVIVKDIEKALDFWCELFDAPRPPVKIQERGPREGTTYRGKPGNYGLKLASVDAKDKGFIIELHEPTGGDSTFQEFLDKHGQGVHHLGFEVGEKRDAIIEELGEKGFKMRTIGANNTWTIVDSEEILGVNLNIKPKR
jgi:catechol 2,3-dioxygenase-like lactoylglutathione lyase family enzyme